MNTVKENVSVICDGLLFHQNGSEQTQVWNPWVRILGGGSDAMGTECLFFLHQSSHYYSHLQSRDLAILMLMRLMMMSTEWPDVSLSRVF